jgi:CBS domain-containing protein
VRSGAVELRNARDELVARLGEGEVHAAGCGDDPDSRQLAGRAVEDTLLLLVPCETVRALRAAHPGFDRWFATTLREKLRRVTDALDSAPALGGGLMTIDVGSLVRREPVLVAPDAAIAEVARRMTRERVSSALVGREEVVEGIVTDGDLRERCLAGGIAPDRPVREIMTARLHTIDKEAPAFEALLAMARLGIRHLPVRDRERVIGLVTTTDLVRQQSASAVYVAKSVRRSASLAELVEASARLPELQVQLVAAGATARQLGQAVTAVADAIAQRLLELAEARLGPAPVPYAWLACGSQARHEQTVSSDQDNALLLSDAYDPGLHAGWFVELARSVNDGLAACGFAPCAGGVMASTPRWRQPLSGWKGHFDGWISKPSPKALMHVGIFFDMRAVAGDAALLTQLGAHVRELARRADIFLALLTASALRHRTPLGLFRNFVLIRGEAHADTFDLKKGGIMPIVDLARVHALACGSDALGTVDRLREAAERRVLSREGAEELTDAFDFAGALRARHQAEQLKRGATPDSHLRPDELSPLVRDQLKAAFAVVRRHQAALAEVHQLGRLV